MANFWLLAILVAATLAEEPCSTDPSVALKFRLVAKVTRGESDFDHIQNWAVSSYHVGACYDYGILKPKTEGIDFYVNGTKAGVKAGKSDVLTIGGTPSIPYGFVITDGNDADKQGRRGVQVNCGYGTAGVGISLSTKSLHHLVYHDKAAGEGQFYACVTTLPYGPDVVLLYYRSATKKTPSHCADLTLYPECAGNRPDVAGHAQSAPCYPDVAAIR